MKHKDKFSKPSSFGRVAGEGLSTKWSEYYKAGRKERKTSSESQQCEVLQLKAQVARIPEMVEEQVRDQLGVTITAIIPTLVSGLQAWMAGGQQGPPLIPSFMGSNSRNTPAAPLVSLAEATLVSPTARRHCSLMHPGVGRIRRPAPLQQAAPPSTARPPLALPRH